MGIDFAFGAVQQYDDQKYGSLHVSSNLVRHRHYYWAVVVEWVHCDSLPFLCMSVQPQLVLGHVHVGLEMHLAYRPR